MNYSEWRRSYYAKFPEFWGSVGDRPDEDGEYAILGALEMPREHSSAVRTAGGRLYPLIARLAETLQQADDRALKDLGIPERARPYCRTIQPEMPPAMYGRFDFAMTAEGPKLLELNSESPYMVVELFHINAHVCADFGLVDPNPGCREQLSNSIQTSISAGLRWLDRDPAESLTVFAWRPGTLESEATSRFHAALAGGTPGRIKVCPIDSLRVTPDVLRNQEGEVVDVLYTDYPTDDLIKDEGASGAPTGLFLLNLVLKRRLATLNTAVTYLMESKALVALLWGLHLANAPLFTAREHRWIDQYVLPTYLQPADDRGRPLFKGPHVIKPIYGSEGGSVTIVDGRSVKAKSTNDEYRHQPVIYQQWVELPTVMVRTNSGPAKMSLIHDCFVVGGVPSAIGVRASRGPIVDHAAYYLPVCHPRD